VKKEKSHDGMVQHARLVAHATNWARDLVNEPAGTMTPSILAEEARTMAKEVGLNIAIHDKKKIAELKMGMFLGVARGSVEEPRLVQISYFPRDPEAAKRAPVCFVGKAITFDSGGLSLKPSDGMIDMKTDMAGSAAVLGAMKVIARTQPPFPVHAYFGACENMPDGRALKPSDVVTSMSGQTIEVLNTDAEGRLILCDALTYAERFKPRAVVDIATLTGACVIALGAVRSGLFSSDEGLAQALAAAGDAAMDPCWRMPLDEDYAEGLKSNFADVANIAGRAAGSVTAAKFLQRFAGQYPWAHLDIAGTAWKSGAAKGATGRPVGLLVEYLLGQAQTPAPSVSAAPKAEKALKAAKKAPSTPRKRVTRPA
jgi:leucyl aminopeptidase